MRTKDGLARTRDGNGVLGGAGHRPRGEVDHEVIDAEATGHNALERRWLDDRGAAPLDQVGTEGPGAVGGVAEHVEVAALVRQQPRRGLRVADVAGGQVTGGDDARLRLDGDVALEAVAVGMD